MGLLVLWLGCALTIGIAYAGGRHATWAVVEPGATAVALCALGAALAVVGLCGLGFEPRRNRTWAALQVIAVLLLCGARGWSAGEAVRTATWPAAGRGLPTGIVELEVEGASTSGPRCQAVTRAPTGGPRLLLSMPEDACPLASGQRIGVRAEALRLAEAPLHPGGADPVDRAQAQGAARLGAVERAWNRRAAPAGSWTWVAEGRHRAWTLARGDDALSFVFASTLGARSVLSPHRREELQAAGLGHLVAVSGLHVALLSWVLRSTVLRVASLITGSPRVGIVVSWIPMIAYVGLTGAPASAVRAASMLILLGLGSLVGRPVHGLTVLAVAATGMLLYRPAWSIDPSFQLSVAAMAALTRSPPGAGVVLTTWRVTWAIAPLSALHFAQTSVWGLVANLVAVPVFGLVVLPLGLAGWLAQPWLGDGVLAPARSAGTLIVDLAAVVSTWPTVPSDAVAACAAVFVLGGPTLVRRGLGHLRPPWIACMGMIAVWSYAQWVRPLVAPAHGWVAVGSARDPTIVARPRGDTASACLVAAGGSAVASIALARAMGIERVGWPHPHASTDGDVPPHVASLIDGLERHHMWSDQAIACEVPDLVWIRSLARACRRLTGDPVVVLVGSEPSSCWVRGRWIPIPSAEKRFEGSSGLLD